MKIVLARSAGFCFGVRHAVQTAEKLVGDAHRNSHGRPVQYCMLGELIHNRAVIDSLRCQGMGLASDPSEIQPGTAAVIRTHGIAPSVRQELEQRGIELVDVTCPYVDKIHRIVRRACLDGKGVIVAGEAGHPEVDGIIGECDVKAYVVADAEEAATIEAGSREWILVAQTTFSTERYAEIRRTLQDQIAYLQIFDTICTTTESRQREAADIARQVDLMLVIGSPGSSNTRKLYEVCRSRCGETHLVENPVEATAHLAGKSLANLTIGITAGASTPEQMIREVIQAMTEQEARQDMQEQVRNANSAEEVREGVREAGSQTNPEPVPTTPADASEQKEELGCSLPMETEEAQEAAEQPKAAEQPAATEPAAAEQPAATEPAAAEQPAATEPAAAEQPAATEPAAAEQPAATEPAAAEQPAATEPAAVVPPASAPAPAPGPDAPRPAPRRENRREGHGEGGDISFTDFIDNIPQLKRGATVRGTIIRYDNEFVYIDVRDKSEGRIARSEFEGDPDFDLEEAAARHAEIDVYVRNIRNTDLGKEIQLSKARVDFGKHKNLLEEAYNNKTPITVKIVNVVKDGVIANFGGIDIYIHRTQLELNVVSDLEPYRGRSLEILVTQFDPEKKRLRVSGSRRALLAAERRSKAEEVWQTIEVGKHYDGIVRSLTDFGAFVDIGGVDGLVHVTELSWNRIRHPSEVVKVGDPIHVYVKDFDPERKRISLGYKSQSEDPYHDVEERFPVNSIVRGIVVRMFNFGAFIEIAPGVDALCHISQISNVRLNKPNDVLAEGMEVDARVLEVSNTARRISISIKDVEPIDPMPAGQQDYSRNYVDPGLQAEAHTEAPAIDEKPQAEPETVAEPIAEPDATVQPAADDSQAAAPEAPDAPAQETAQE